jgi:hypothetical protein
MSSKWHPYAELIGNTGNTNHYIKREQGDADRNCEAP